MKIIVIAAHNAGSPKAHAINLIKTAKGFHNCGHEVILITKKSFGTMSKTALYNSYGIPMDILWIQLPNFLGEHLLFAIATLPLALKLSPDLVYARNYAVPWLWTRFGVNTVGESHAHPSNESTWFKKFLQSSHNKFFKALITINETLGVSYLNKGAASKILVLPDAVDPKLFERPNVLPSSPYRSPKKIVTYAGHLYDYKGIPTILEAAKELPDIEFHLVGGLPEDIDRQKKRISDMKLANVYLDGLKPHAEVPNYLWHADILLLPPSADHPSARWTSPVKAGEYLLSGTPVIATSIPALKRWFTDKEVEFINPDAPHEMATAIRYLLSNKERRDGLTRNGIKWALENTYAKRAEKIVEYVRDQAKP